MGGLDDLIDDLGWINQRMDDDDVALPSVQELGFSFLTIGVLKYYIFVKIIDCRLFNVHHHTDVR